MPSAAVLVVLVGVLESMVALAYRDGLTGLPGRRGLNDKLRQLGRRYAIAMLDVDHFKRFNDRFGHRTGDDVLKMIAVRMQQIPADARFVMAGRSSRLFLREGLRSRRSIGWRRSVRPWPARPLWCDVFRVPPKRPAVV